MFLEPMLASSTPEKKRLSLSSASGYLLEPKHDGMRAIVSKHDGEVKIYSRVGLEYQDHLPDLAAEFQQLPDGTILDGELMVVKSRVVIDGYSIAVADFNATMRIMGSGIDKAIDRQKDTKIEFCVFDIPKLGGESVENVSYGYRKILLSGVIANLYMPSVFRNPSLREWEDSFIDKLMLAGIEGAILKNQESLYITGKRRANNWYKVKAELTADVAVMGFTAAKEGVTGKYLGKIGAIVFGAYNSAGDLIEVGQCSGMDDAGRDYWTAIRDSGEDLTQVIEVKYNDLVGSGEFGTPRHPQFRTERIDKRPQDCLMEQFQLN